MKLHQNSILLLFLFLYVPLMQLSAQQMKIVSGRVVDKLTNKPITTDVVDVYSFNTVAQAEDAKKLFDAQSGDYISFAETVTANQYGEYEIHVPDNGALIFKTGVAKAVLEKVEGRLLINIAIDAGIVIQETVVVEKAVTVVLPPLPPQRFGDKLIVYNNFSIPEQYGRDNGRLIIQPFLIDCQTEDTVYYTKPIIRDGEQYYKTQERRMSYDLSNDPLARFVDSRPLTTDTVDIQWVDTVEVPHADREYHVNAVIQVEDYNTVFYSKDFLVSPCQAKKPLKFLEYTIGNYRLNPKDYYIKPKREKMDTSSDISLTFAVGKAELDPENPDNEVQMNELRQSLLDIVNGEGTTLKEFHVTGVASPEGNYQSNLVLAQRRVRFAQEQATSLIPKHVLARVYQNPQARVATWTEVAELLEKDSLFDEAKEIRAIVDKYPKNPDVQFAAVARLPYYATIIKEHLPKLRSVHYECKHEIYRALLPEEIYARYREDPDYRDGKKKFLLAEYWHLFNMEKDPKKLQQLYKDAYEVSKEMGTPWVYAANNLAVSYLKEGINDTTILAPFINTGKKLNAKTYMNGIVTETVNQEEVVANQLATYLKMGYFDKASVLAQMLPRQKFKTVWAFTLCLGGYYMGDSKEAKEIFSIVSESSPLNKVVMYLALDTPLGNKLAERNLKELSDDDPITWYLKAIIKHRSGDDYMGGLHLAECFKRDTKYIPMAEQDGEFFEEKGEAYIITAAKDEYDVYKSMQGSNMLSGKR